MDKFGLRELLRYGYAGFLCVLVAALMDGPSTQALITWLGPVLAPLAALAVGALVYVLFRAGVGDFFLWRFVHSRHMKQGVQPAQIRCKVRFLEKELGVTKGQGEQAYRLVRDTLLEDHQRENFHTQHSECHILYLTSSVCLLAFFVYLLSLPLAWTGLLPRAMSSLLSWTFLAIAVLTFVAGLFQDARICWAERAAVGELASRDREKLDRVLRGGGFLAEREQTNSGTGNAG
jgi:hypothetical protein